MTITLSDILREFEEEFNYMFAQDFVDGKADERLPVFYYNIKSFLTKTITEVVESCPEYTEIFSGHPKQSYEAMWRHYNQEIKNWKSEKLTVSD